MVSFQPVSQLLHDFPLCVYVLVDISLCGMQVRMPG